MGRPVRVRANSSSMTMRQWLGLMLFAGYFPAVAAIELTGPLEQGGMVIGTVAPGTAVSLDGKAIKVSADGRFVIGFDRDAASKAVLIAAGSEGQERMELTIKARKYQIQRIEGIAQTIMSPSAANLKRIGEEAAQVSRARARHYERMDFAGEFHWPLLGPITGVFGSQRVYNGEPRRPHYGLDVAAPIGTPVTTPAPGVVTLAHPDMFYSGGTLIIDHGFGVSSTLMHLSKVLVTVGQEVVPGDLVAEVGAAGRATGPHLDWRMNWHKVRIDPQLLVSPMPGKFSASKPVMMSNSSK